MGMIIVHILVFFWDWEDMDTVSRDQAPRKTTEVVAKSHNLSVVMFSMVN